MLERLPPPEQLAKMVSSVTQTMLGITFTPAGDSVTASLGWRSAVLPIPGATPITVGLSSNQSGCERLSSAMFSVSEAEVDNNMMDDSLCELVNMTAGLVKSALSLDQALGLPKIMGSVETIKTINGGQVRAVVLQAKSTGLILWVCEGLIQI